MWVVVGPAAQSPTEEDAQGGPFSELTTGLCTPLRSQGLPQALGVGQVQTFNGALQEDLAVSREFNF